MYLLFYKPPYGEFSINNLYIGQTQNVSTRLHYHYLISKSTSKKVFFTAKQEGLYFYILKLGDIEKLNYNTLINFPTFQYLYFKEFGYNPNPELLFILQSFTEFKLGLYEQALISYYNPGLNITKLINFIFIN